MPYILHVGEFEMNNKKNLNERAVIPNNALSRHYTVYNGVAININIRTLIYRYGDVHYYYKQKYNFLFHLMYSACVHNDG